MGDSLSELSRLPTRPPTPPKEAEVNGAGKTLDYTSYLLHPKRQNIATPDDSPSSSAEYFIKTSDKVPKRVDFSPWVSYTPPSITSKGSQRPDQQVRLLPPSKECRSSKSILKPYDLTSNLEYISSKKKDRKPVPEMLEDLCRELASTSRSPRLDAYLALNDCLKAYKDVPDRQALENKLPLLTGFIRRDLTAVLNDAGAMDIQLITQALKLLTTLVWTLPSITSLLHDEFCTFVVDRAITSFGESQNISKAIVCHYLHVLSIQKFGPKIMTNDRVGRLLDTIQEIHVKGNGIVGQRLIVYRRLLSQAKSLMAARASDWVDHLFTGMLSTLKEVRRRAVDFGLEAALNLGSVSQTSRCVLEIFDRRSSEGKRFRDLLISRLNDMIGSPDECSHVPPIWSIVILFFQSRRSQLEHWEHMRDWVSVIQKCFNSSDKKTKFQATLAWNRLIYTVNPDVTTKNSMLRMLRQPMMPLDRKSNTKKSPTHAKSSASSSYCTLLYYVFRPGSSFEQLDRSWAECVDPILPASLSASESDTTFACQILISLFGDAQQKPWAENRGHEGHIVKPEELPRLDPRWTRLRASTIMKIFEIMFISANWQTSKNEEAWILQAWSSFTRALGDAGSKEVKISAESLGAIAHILNSVKHFWFYNNSNMQTPPDSDPNQSILLRRLISLVKLAVENLGYIVFAEKRLTRSTDELFEAAETPSSRTSHAKGVLSSPVVHLIEMLSSSVIIDEVQGLYKETIADWIQVAIRGSTLRQKKLKILHEIAFLTMTATSRSPEAKLILWQTIVEFIDLQTIHPGSKMDIGSTSLGHEYRDIVKILEIGIRMGFEPSQSWSTLIQTTLDGAKQEIGAGGVAIIIIEPLASSLNQEIIKGYDRTISQCCIAVLQNTVWPRSRKEMEHAHRVLWGTSTVSLKTNPFDHLYSLSNSLLCTAHQDSHKNDPNNIIGVLQASITVLSSCPPSLLAVLLQRIQCGLAKWLEDADGLMDGSSADLKEIFSMVQRLGSAVAKSIQALPNFDSKHLSAIEFLMVASLSSRHKSIVNEFITLWNHTFGISIDIEYSETLRRTLSRLNKYTDILMYQRNVEEETELNLSPLNFIETQSSLDYNMTQNLGDRKGEEMELPDSTSKVSAEKTEPSKAHGIQARSTPEPTKDRKRSKTASNPCFRHENSQIEFAAIESSPYDLDALESQLLTTRQKEVKARQQQEAAAMFPDLRSSPRPKSRGSDHDLPKLYQESHRKIRNQDFPDEMSSPILPPADSRVIDSFVGSSPTPRSNRHSASRVSQFEDPPSSPPALARLTTVLNRTSESNSSNSLIFQLPITQNYKQVSGNVSDSEALSRSLAQPASELEDGPDHELELPKTATLCREEEVNAITPNAPKSKDHAPSDLEIFVDAPSTPNKLNPVLDRDAYQDNEKQESYDKHVIEDVAIRSSLAPEREVTNEPQDSQHLYRNTKVLDEQAIVDSFNKRASPDFASLDPDEQISAQIATDMERALSQADQYSIDVSTSTSTTASCKKKRKRGAGIPVRSSKRHKSRTPSKVQVIIERRQTPVVEDDEVEDDEVYDCIVVASQSDKEKQSPSLPTYKKQQPHISVASPRVVLNTMSVTDKKRSSSLERPIVDNLHENDAKQPKKLKSDPNDVIMDLGDPTQSLPVNKRQQTSTRRFSEDDTSKDEMHSLRLTTTSASVSPKALASNLQGEDDTPTENNLDHAITVTLPQAITAKRSYPENEMPHRRVRSDSTPNLPDNERDAKMKVQRPSAAYGRVEEAEDVSSKVKGIMEEDQGRPVTNGKMLTRLKLILEDARHAVLGPTEARDFMSTWMELGKELHEAGDRSTR